MATPANPAPMASATTPTQRGDPAPQIQIRGGSAAAVLIPEHAHSQAAKATDKEDAKADKGDQQQRDLATEEGVRAYLAETPWASAEVSPLTGGTANYVFRLHLLAPYQGKTTLVFKHAKPYVKNYRALAFGLERQIYEVEALRRVRKWLPDNAVVTVPEVFLFDEAAHAIIMEDTGAESISLKTFMQNGGPSLAMAEKIGASIGLFLGGMHKWGTDNEELLSVIKGNDQAKRMSAWVFYGRLISTLDGKDRLPKLQNPPLEVAADDLVAVKRVAQETTQACLEVDNSFVMGDFWPGNMMVQLDAQGELKRIYVIDWELCKAGLTGMEVGQFVGEIHLLRRCNPDTCRETASLVLKHFFKEYKRACEPSVEVARRALVQWGTHMATLGARVEWGGKELSREVVLEGVRILVDGYDGSEDWLKQSLVGGMLVVDDE